ncbi:unnamed protein product [Hymenolepis diminuta]|uniref:EGF-like domain-containing protein n=1 Tax=Hymenolepis diminuta TaxID=6216 RepID=A0A564XZX3_HYMDI|nr:unnamed protein product [Hymenolepis diminuta]
MYERRVLRNNYVSIFIFFILLQIQIRSINADYVVKEISNPERYLNLLDEETELDFHQIRGEKGDNKNGTDFLFVRLDSSIGHPIFTLPPLDTNSDDSLTSHMILPSGDDFRWYSTNGIRAKPTLEEADKCPWNFSACSNGVVYLRFDFLHVKDIDRSSGLNVPVKLVSLEPYLLVEYEIESEIVRASWANHVVSEARLPGGISDWTTVELLAKPNTAEMDLVISNPEGESVYGDSKMFAGPLYPPYAVQEAGVSVGPKNHPRRILTLAAIRQLKSLSGFARPKRNVYNSDRGANISAINFDGTNGFVRFDFQNRIRLPRTDAEVGREEVALDFVLKPGVTSGLLWFAKGAASKSFIIIKDRRLYYKYIAYDETYGAKRTLTEEIVINETLEPGKTHRLRLNRYQDVLRLSLGTQQQFKKIVSGKAPLIPENGVIYIGGSDNAAISTDGEVERNFDGSVTAAKITQEGSGITNLNMLELIRDPNWNRNVLRNGVVEYEYHMPYRPPVQVPKTSIIDPNGPLMPTASTRGHAGITLHTSPIPVTFMGTQSSVVRFDTWDFSTFHSFEMEFRTFEPNGVLFFVGPDREHTDFVCVEIFDGNVYFAYGIGDHYRHIQLNPVTRKVNTGTAHRVYVERTPQHRFIVKYNDQEIDVDQGTSRHQAEFSSYTYFGSIDQPSRFPWIVWSRENFAGCINFIRVNDDKFLDPASRMNQHTDFSRGIQFGVCKAPELRCNREICDGGQCHERSYPFFEPMNFACDCSASDKTFREGVMDIRRSESCNRDAPIVEFDGETVLMIDFERQMNTLTTHTDDINLQFKTESLYSPLFVAVSTAEKQYFRVELENGLIKVTTNMNKASNPPRDSQFILQSPRLNDNNWHTLRIRRRAQFLYISVDNTSEKDDVLTVEIPKGVFNNIAQQIYVGGMMPDNYASPPYGNMAGFLPRGPKFVGEMRNFYWNQYDFFGTRQLPTHYTTDVLTPRLELPTFPSWPREPIYSITCTSKLNWGTIQVPMKATDAGDMWLLEFKTKYDGVLTHARDETTGSHFTLMILKGRLHLIYSIGGVTGVQEIINSPITVSDNVWHRVTFGLDRIKGRFVVIVDDSAPETFGHRLQHNTLNTLTFHFGGVPRIWSKILEIIRLHAPTSLPSGYEMSPPALTGCLGGFSTRTDRFLVDLLKKYDANLESYPTGEIIRGYCRDLVRCTPDYCFNGGICVKVSDTVLLCNCTNTGYSGPKCEDRVTTCPPNFCLNGGYCSIIGTNPVCNCQGTGYYGDHCEFSVCSSDYCKNGGICTVVNGQPVCDCRNTPYGGARCDAIICPPDYCRNGGVCLVQNGRPVCDCSGTGHSGLYCDQPVCSPHYCRNGGRCIIQGGQPICDCSSTGHSGRFCEIPICRPDYCRNGGRCMVQNDRPVCDCRGTGYEGLHCENAICRSGYCMNGGVCSIVNGRPVCDCTNTGYGGQLCEQPICRPGFCLNGGRCIVQNGQPVCDCRDTGYVGPHCEQGICRSDYCMNGGVCSVINGQPVCDCRNTGHGGSLCEQPICPDGYCANGGRCVVQNGRPYCDCTGTDYRGDRCTHPICLPNFCLNGGYCYVYEGSPHCNCTADFRGDRCQSPVCPAGYCENNGRCYMSGSTPMCDCTGTGHTGDRCTNPICPDGYCQNGGVCHVLPSGQPFCDCSYTLYTGDQCENPICQPNYCSGRGTCRVEQGRPVCDCQLEYWGPQCQLQVCPPGFCRHGGTCYAGPDRRPHCRCPEGYDGDQCEIPKSCPPGYCYHGGECTMQSGMPVCNCINTDYQGPRCETPKTCPPGYCQNGGLCTVSGGRYICNCFGTGFQGPTCSDPVACPAGYCHGGICTVLPGGRYLCNCWKTGLSGPTCDGDVNGIYIDYEKVGYMVYDLNPPFKTTEDNVTVGFKTYSQSGTILDFVTTIGAHWGIKIRNGHIVVDRNGQEYMYPNIVNDGAYHIVSIERRGDRMLVTLDNDQIVNLPMTGITDRSDQSITYTTLYVGADRNREDIFRGAIGGLYWNGRYPIDEAKGGLQVITGEVIYVLLPSFILPGKKPVPQCLPDFCFNGGICYVKDYELKCDCRLTGWQGSRCEQPTRGVLPAVTGNGAYIILSVSPPKRTNVDRMRVAFQTYATDGPIARFMSNDGRYYDVYMKGQQVFVSNTKDEIRLISAPYQQCDDGKMHVITLARNGSRWDWSVDGHHTTYYDTYLLDNSASLITNEIILGADRNFRHSFNGVIGAFDWNGQNLVSESGELSVNSNVMIVPGRGVGDKDDVVIVVMPHLLMPPIATTQPPPLPFPPSIPVDGVHGGAIVGSGVGDGNLVVPPIGYGGGSDGVFAGSGPLLLQAGGAGVFGLINPWLAGLLVCLLPLISALIWACWRCKPGCCPCCVGGAGLGKGSGGKFHDTMDRISAGLWAAPPADKDLLGRCIGFFPLSLCVPLYLQHDLATMSMSSTDLISLIRTCFCFRFAFRTYLGSVII